MSTIAPKHGRAVDVDLGRAHDAAAGAPSELMALSISPQETGNTALLTAAGGAQDMRRAAFDLSAIAPVLTAGFRAVLVEATGRGVLDPPHGRTPMPEPKKIIENCPRSVGNEGGVDTLSERKARSSADESHRSNRVSLAEVVHFDDVDEDGSEEDYDDDEDDEKLLEYKFDYGFNPLVFLGEYLRRKNPALILARKERRVADFAYLRRRGIKCLEREAAAHELRELVVLRRTGVVYGPIIGEVSDCGGILWATVYRSGELIVELSRHEDFHDVCRQKASKVDRSTEYMAVVEFDDLDPSTTWHYRTHLNDPQKGFDGPTPGFCIKGKFSTLPERDGDSNRACRFAVFSLYGLGCKTAAAYNRDEIEAACSSLLAAKPEFCLVLGEPSTPQGTSNASGGVWKGFGDLQETAVMIPTLAQLFQGNGFLTASGLISKAANTINKEGHQNTENGPEVGSSRAEYMIAGSSLSRTGETKKAESQGGDEGHDENGPTMHAWPLRCPDSWGSRSLGPSAEIFLVDGRNGFIGDDQLAWLSDAIQESRRTWKDSAVATLQAKISSRQESVKDTQTVAGASATPKKSASPVPPATAVIADAAATPLEELSSRVSTVERGRPGDQAEDCGSVRPEAEPGKGGVEGRRGQRERSDKCGPSSSTLQIQGMVSKLCNRGCSNVVLLTPSRSWPHALSFFSGHEDEGRFPVYELGCCGLLSRSLNGESNSGARSAATEPYPDLEAADLMPDLTRQSTRDSVLGMICFVSVGNNVDNQRNQANTTRDDALSFAVYGAGGEEMALLQLVPAA